MLCVPPKRSTHLLATKFRPKLTVIILKLHQKMVKNSNKSMNFHTFLILDLVYSNFLLHFILCKYMSLAIWNEPVYLKRHNPRFHDVYLILSKTFCSVFHQKEALIFWLLNFVLSCTIIIGELHQKMVSSSNKSTKIW